MRLISETPSGGVFEQLFTLGEIPGVLWTPEGAAGTRPLILMGHGGGQHKRVPDIAARARRFVAECGFAVVAVDVPSHGDRPDDEEYSRIAAQNQARVDAGEELAPLIAEGRGFRMTRTRKPRDGRVRRGAYSSGWRDMPAGSRPAASHPVTTAASGMPTRITSRLVSGMLDSEDSPSG